MGNAHQSVKDIAGKSIEPFDRYTRKDSSNIYTLSRYHYFTKLR